MSGRGVRVVVRPRRPHELNVRIPEVVGRERIPFAGHRPNEQASKLSFAIGRGRRRLEFGGFGLVGGVQVSLTFKSILACLEASMVMIGFSSHPELLL
jgi:hypothetical protein